MPENVVEAVDVPAEPEAKKLRQPSPRELEVVRRLVDEANYAGAERAARKLTARYRKNSLAWQVVSVVLDRRGKTEASLDAAETAANLSPEDAEARYQLANLLRLRGRLADAEAEYRKALALNPDHCDANLNLGVTLKSQGRVEESEGCYRAALRVEPRNALALSNLALVLCQLGRLDEAEEHYGRAIEADPKFAELHSNLASLLIRRGRVGEAEASSRRALELMPTLFAAWNNLGFALQTAGRIREAVEPYRRAIALKPDYAEARSNLLFCLSHQESVTADELFAEHVSYGRHFGSPWRARWPAHRNSREPERRLKVGFVSGDLRDHAVAYFLEPLLPHLAEDPGLSLHAYSNSLIVDEVSMRLRGCFDSWTRVADVGDDALTAQIEADAIDILVDLSGHTSGNRLLVFARKPAPVQASWIGYPGTTGLEAIDYYFGDRFFLPLDRFASQFTERIAHLPAVSPFLPPGAAPRVNPLPALANGHVTFGSFNREGKLSPAVVALWSRLLHALPAAEMVIGALSIDDNSSTRLREWFAASGISANRLRLLPRGEFGDYLALHHQVDICLDTFPYGGCTTTLHALWMGVPTLSLEGATPAGREGSTFLRHLGLDDFVAADGDGFVGKGVAAAAKLDLLAELRCSLRQRFQESALNHPEAIAEGLSHSLRKMWRRWCARLPPEAF